MEYIKSDFQKLYDIKEKLSLEKVILANEYELLTFTNLKYIFRKYIESYNNKRQFDINYNKLYKDISPIPIGFKIGYLGRYDVYTIDILNYFPVNSSIAILKTIGPGEINENNDLILYEDQEFILSNYNKNKVFSYYNYYDWGNNTKYNKDIESKFDFYLTDTLKLPKKYHNQYNNVIINEFSIKKRKEPDNEEKSYEVRKKFILNAIKMLKKNGTMYLEFFIISLKKTFILIHSLNELFDNITFIRAKLYDNTLNGGYFIFQNYNGKNLKLIYSENKHLKAIISTVQDNITKKFTTYLKKCKSIKIKNKNKYINYQISIGIDWCNENNIEINKYYINKLYKLNNITYLKKIFYPAKINYKNLRLYYDTFYSITNYKDGVKISQKIKEIFPKCNTIIDACANVGGSTITFAHLFDKVISIEIDDKRFKLLLNNINTYKLKNVLSLNIDYDLFNSAYTLTNTDVVFFDPPWGGIFYKIEENFELFLGSKNIKTFLKTGCVLKAPFNYNYSDIKNIKVITLDSYLLIFKL